MKRLLAVLLMFLLPYQMTLAATMAIEMEAPAAAMQTAGEDACHHADNMAMADEATVSADQATHGHCGLCHFSGGSALPMLAVMAMAQPLAESPHAQTGTQLPAPPAARPERPKWGSLA